MADKEKAISIENLSQFTKITEKRHVGRNEKHAVNGVAELDEDGFIYTDQIRSGFGHTYFLENRAAFPAVGDDENIYIAVDTGKMYKFDPSLMTYVETTEIPEYGKEDEAKDGKDGKSAFEIANEVRESNGEAPFANEAEWLASLAQSAASDLEFASEEDIEGLFAPLV